MMAHCPDCEAAIDVDDEIEEGATLDCPDCGASLEVVATNPVELNVVTSGGEDEEEEAW